MDRRWSHNPRRSDDRCGLCCGRRRHRNERLRTERALRRFTCTPQRDLTEGLTAICEPSPEAIGGVAADLEAAASAVGVCDVVGF